VLIGQAFGLRQTGHTDQQLAFPDAEPAVQAAAGRGDGDQCRTDLVDGEADVGHLVEREIAQ